MRIFFTELIFLHLPACTCSQPSLVSPSGRRRPSPAMTHPTCGFCPPACGEPEAALRLHPHPAPCPRYLPGLQPRSKGIRGRLRLPRPQRWSRLRDGRRRPRPFWVRAEVEHEPPFPSLPFPAREGSAAPRWRRCQYSAWRRGPPMLLK